MSVILEALGQLVESTASGCYCGVVLVDPSGTRLELGAAPSLPSSFITSVIGQPVSVESGPSAMAAYLIQQVIAADLASETRWMASGWRAMALRHGLRACWSTPFASSAGKVLGAFGIYYDEPKTPTPIHQNLIEQFTHIASIAVERAQNDAALKRSEARKAALLEATGRRNHPPALREEHRRGLARYLATGETRMLGRRVEMTAVRADGTEFPTELAITRIPLDGPPSFTGYLRDITELKRSIDERKRAETRLATENRLLEMVASGSPLPEVLIHCAVLSKTPPASAIAVCT